MGSVRRPPIAATQSLLDLHCPDLYSAAMLTSRFQYELPQDRIALYPPAERTDAQLMLLSRATGQSSVGQTVAALVDQVRPGDCWVINDTRVRPARVFTRKPTGGRVELLVLSARGTTAEAMYRASKPPKAGQVLIAESTGDELRVTHNFGDGRIGLELPENVDPLLERAGQIPLPPYIDRAPDEADRERYQTVYARDPGAVAAPTAGLHFTPELMADMEAAGARFARVTLHVGAGTFRPIRSESIDDHSLHTESWTLTPENAELINSASRVVAVGTTSVRTLETAATGPGRVEAGSGDTGLYIKPGFDFQVVQGLLTNFHLPGSSLLVLVAALTGLDPMMAAYQKALDSGFRFYSYGDAMFIS